MEIELKRIAKEGGFLCLKKRSQKVRTPKKYRLYSWNGFNWEYHKKVSALDYPINSLWYEDGKLWGAFNGSPDNQE